MKLKQTKKIIFSISTLLGATTVFSLPLVFAQMSKNNNIKMNKETLANEEIGLDLPLQESNSINKEITLNYDEIAKKAQKNPLIKKWIKDISKKKRKVYLDDLKDLYKLHIPYQEKLFMKKNLKEKYNTRKMQQNTKPHSMNSYIFSRLSNFNGEGSGGSGSGYTPKEYKPPEMHKNVFIVRQDNVPIISRKTNEQIIANGSDGQKIIDNWVDKDESYFWWSNQKIYNIMASNLVTKEVKEAGRIFNKFSRFFTHNTNTWTSTLMGNNISEIGTLLKEAKKNNDSISKKLRIKFESGREELNIIKANTQKNSVHSLVKNILDASIGTGLTSIPVIGIALGEIWMSLHLVGPGNDNSFIENWNDHGLNDWIYQWKHNAKNMSQTAYNFSNYLEEGVEWKVTDGWFSYPELYVRSQKENSNWKFISPGTSFNFGNKLKIWSP